MRDFEKFARDKGVSSLTLGGYTSHITDGWISPTILEERKLNVTQMDVFSRLMQERIIFLGTEIDDDVANIMTAQLLYLESVGNDDITLYVNSPGGVISSGMSIVDTMNYISSDVSTVTTGMAASMGAIIASSGTKGKRFILQHGRFLLHQPLGGVKGQASEIEIEYKEIQKYKEMLYQILAENTGQSYEKIWKDADRDFWLNAQESLDYGLVDKIITKK
jgi:ATP-dependent Clp protease, protease subunit